MAKHLADLLLEVALPRRWPRRLWLAAAFVSTFLAGAATWHLLFGVQVAALRENVSEWRVRLEQVEDQYQRDHRQALVTTKNEAWNDLHKRRR